MAMTTHTRQRIAAILLKLLAIGFGLCTLPFLGEGFGNLLDPGPLQWSSFVWLGLALLPGSIAYGLWRRRRWTRTAALWVSIMAIPLLPLLGIAVAAFTYSGALALMVGSFLGLFPALIVFFLTSPETKALFGVSTETVIQRRPMISRPSLLVILLAGFVIAGGTAGLLIISETAEHRRQAAIDERINERIAGELKPLIEAQLRTMGAEGFVNQHCGAFQSLDGFHLWRMRLLSGMGRNLLQGVAHFEKADLRVSVDVTFVEGPTNVELRFSPDDNWLKEHPDFRVRIVDRRLEASADEIVAKTTTLGRINGSATHPYFARSE